MNSILNRRSIRKYTKDAVNGEQIEMILRAAMAAPSAHNQQPWHFVVISDRSILERISALHPHAQMAKSAAAAIVVCGDPSLEKTPGFWIQDCAAATQNMLLAIEDLGLGAVWCGVYPREDRVQEMRFLLNIPSHITPFSLVPLGHPAEVKEPSNRYDPARVHQDTWIS